MRSDSTERKAASGGAGRLSTKAKLATELVKLGRVIALTRERRGLKQQDVAFRLGLPASHLSKIEKGTRRLDVVELLQLAEAMGVDAADLIKEIESGLLQPGS